MEQREMQKEQPSPQWTFDKTNLFCEVLDNPVNNFMKTLKKQILKRSSTREAFDFIIVALKEGLEKVHFNKKIQKPLKQKRKKPN